jgi:hypothetical protein
MEVRAGDMTDHVLPVGEQVRHVIQKSVTYNNRLRTKSPDVFAYSWPIGGLQLIVVALHHVRFSLNFAILLSPASSIGPEVQDVCCAIFPDSGNFEWLLTPRQNVLILFQTLRVLKLPGPVAGDDSASRFVAPESPNVVLVFDAGP